ncbi:ribosome biogenesis GTPase YlqF [Parathalassolituus penaei]|uniref:Ribosome biogenesis GTPase YlqF n=1 Tax=Parathalassolituus penaei TaxID=2997323 RepID=A0A9X3IRY6_9GAMM|nr:ribosome biogenesis GTPase YlqF [Parathalassolituus penaei]MCY0963593.1 ribosome biogenesis GTPase YlqF [Parathalassolituus penaei]
MAVQWFPGHMNKARKKISEAMPEIDLVIEVMDARLPFSSTNPLVDQLRRNRPVIKLLNKDDLADPDVTRQWVEYFSKQDNTLALPLVAEDKSQIKKVIALCKKIGAARAERKQSIRVMVMGIPNVGKSTLINGLAGRYVAKTGNEPAVTKANQMIDLKNGIVLSDTPGILWPKFENEHSGYRLAASGAVKDTAMEYREIAQYTLGYLLKAYPHLLKDRYKMDPLPASGPDALELLGRKRGCLRPGGVIDLHKAAELCLHEMRSGKIGRISLETPDMVADELAEIERLRLAAIAAAEAAEAEARKGKRPQPGSAEAEADAETRAQAAAQSAEHHEEPDNGQSDDQPRPE